MQKTNQKTKSILIVFLVALICLSTAIACSSLKSASADYENANVIIKSAQIVVQKDQDSQNEKWATMFKAEIDLDSYNALTDNGKEAVKLGMLVGPAKRLDKVFDFDSAISQQFEAFAHVGTASSGAQSIIDFKESTTYNYYAGIVYNDDVLSGLNLKSVAALELVAIPYYETQLGKTVLIENNKTATPKNVLIESFIIEKASAVDNIPEQAIDKYVGNLTYNEGEYYICQSTSRIMGAEIDNGILLEQDLGIDQSDTVLLGQTSIWEDGAFDKEKISDLTSSDNKRGLAIIKEDGSIDAYPIKIAKRVITRMFADDTASNLQDYLAYPKTDAQTTKLGNYASIFYMADEMEKTFDGLYVLANSITPIEKGETIFATDGYSGYNAIENKGFIGTFDGRGKSIDFVGSTKQASLGYGGFFPSLYGANIKNVAFNNINAFGVGGSLSGCLTADAKQSTFENVFVKILDVEDFKNNFNGGLLFGAQNNAQNTFKNMIVNADLVDYDYYESTLALKEQYQIVSSQEKGFGAMNKGLWSGKSLGGQKSFDNFFAVGKNPAVLTSNNGEYVLTPDNILFYSITKMPYYNHNGTIKQCENYLLDDKTGQPTYITYTLDQFLQTADINGGTDKNQNTIPDYIEEIFKHAQYVLECRFGKLEVQSQIENGVPISVNFACRQGLYDLSTADFEQFIKDQNNSESLSKFDLKYWHLDIEQGQLSWKDLTEGAHEHVYKDIITNPTCTEQGYTTHLCLICGQKKVDSYSKALGHKFIDYIYNNDATCTKDGTKTAKCTRCDQTETIIKEGSMTEHDYEWIIDVPATQTETGLKHKKCTGCGDEIAQNTVVPIDGFVYISLGDASGKMISGFDGMPIPLIAGEIVFLPNLTCLGLEFIGYKDVNTGEMITDYFGDQFYVMNQDGKAIELLAVWEKDSNVATGPEIEL